MPSAPTPPAGSPARPDAPQDALLRALAAADDAFACLQDHLAALAAGLGLDGLAVALEDGRAAAWPEPPDAPPAPEAARVPLVHDDAALGHLLAYARAPLPGGAAAALADLAALLAGALARQARVDGLRGRADRFELLADLAAAASADTSLDALIAAATDRTAAAFPGLRVTFGAVRPDGHHTIVRSRDPVRGTLENVEAGYPLPAAFVAELVAGRLVVVEDVFADPRLAPAAESLARVGVRAALDAPVPHPASGIAFLALVSPVPRRWSAHEREAIRAVGAHLAAALREAHLQQARREDQRLLEERERLMRGVQRLAGLGSYSLDLESGRATWSDELYRLVGASPDRFDPGLGAVRDLVHPEDRTRLDQALERLRAGEPHVTLDFRWRRLDGELRHVHAFGRRPADGPLVVTGAIQDVTDLRRSEQALREREAELAAALEVAGLGTWVFTLGEARATWSPELYGLLGLAPGAVEPTAEAYLDLVVPEDRDALRATLRDLLATGGTSRLLHRVRRADGTLRHVLGIGRLEADGDGGPARVRGTVQDVTGLRELQTSLALREAQLRLLLETVPALVAYVDAGDRVRFVSRAGLRWLGRLSAEVVDHPARRLVGEARYDEVFAPAVARALGGQAATLEVAVPGPDGQPRDLDVTLAPHRLPSDEQAGVLWLGVDVTERRRAERAARRSEQRLRGIFHAMFEFMALAAPDGTLEDLNGQALRAFGLSLEDVVGRPVWELRVFGDRTAPPGAPGDRLEARERLRDAVAAAARGEFVRYEESAPGPDGGGVYIDLSLKPLFGEDGAIAHVLLEGRDVTSLRRAEQEWRAIERKMLHVQKLESLGILAGGIAHDFNNILSAILGNASLALHDVPAGSELRGFLVEIEAAARRAAELATQMLAYSGKGRFVTRPVDLSATVREMAEMLRASIAKHARLELRLEDDLPRVVGDPAQLRQVVMNLLTNASEALADGAGTVRVRTRTRELEADEVDSALHSAPLAPGLYVELTVEDDGVGMDAETRRRIFDPFFTTRLKGRGLGLAAVQGIVRGHAGLVEVESSPGKGSVFRVVLPADRSVPPAQEAPPAPLPPPAPPAATVLLVDDEAIVRRLARRALERSGLRVVEAVDGADAVARARSASPRPDVVILDLSMPGPAAGEVYDALRALLPGARVVLSSGYDEPDARAALGRDGLDGFLAKPYDVEQLTAAVLALAGAAGER